MRIESWPLAALSVFGIAVQAWSAIAFLARSRPSRRAGEGALPPLSVLKPLKGKDGMLEENLRSFFEADYPEFELVFCLESPADPAFEIAERLVREYRRVPARFFFSSQADDLPNPKISNLRGGYLSARFDLVLVSDSNVRIGRDSLRRLVPELSGDVGMVTAIVRGTEMRGFPAELEAMVLNTFYARGMALAESAGRACVVGKAMLFRRSLLDRMGGLRALGRYLAEDYMAGIGIRQLGRKIRIAADPVDQAIGSYRFADFWKRHLRWGRIRKAQAPFAFLAEFFSQALPTATFGALAVEGGSLRVFAAMLGVSAVFDALVLARFGVPFRPRSFAAWVVREGMAPVHWVAVLIGNEVEWRGRRLRIAFGGMLSRPAAGMGESR